MEQNINGVEPQLGLITTLLLAAFSFALLISTNFLLCAELRPAVEQGSDDDDTKS